MKIISCPKRKWLELVEHMQECVYDTLAGEPNLIDVEQVLRKNCPSISLSDMESTLQFVASQHNNDLKIRSEIENKYGQTYTEACRTLREHVNSCPGCKTDYLRALDSYTESMMDVRTIATENGVCDSEDYLDKISKYDILKVIKPRK